MTATYAYIIPCRGAFGSRPPFEIRVSGGSLDGQRLRLASLIEADCFHDSRLPTPTAGFDSQTGVGIFSGSSGFLLIGWEFFDGGAGGAGDGACMVVSETSIYLPAQVIARFEAVPPGKFPGADQPTGFNTALPGTTTPRGGGLGCFPPS